MSVGLRFSERMAGWITLEGHPNFPGFETGVKYPFEINLGVFSSKIFRLSPPRDLTGYALFPGSDLSPSNPEVTGQLTIRPTGITYEFKIDLGEEKYLSFQGKKTYAHPLKGWNRFRNSLTILPLIVSHEGRQIGTAELVYRKPLWHFPLGIRLSKNRGERLKRQDLAARVLIMTRVFVTRSETLIEPQELQHRLQMDLEQIPVWAEWLTRSTLFWIQVLSLLLFRRTVGRLDGEQSQRFSRLFMRNSTLRILALSVSVPLLSAAYSSPKYVAKKGQNVPTPPTTSEPERWMSLCHSPTSSWSEQSLEVDFVIIGSGAGGGAAAYELASQGHAVAIVEEGAYFKRKDFTGDRVDVTRKLFRDSGYSFTVSNAMLWLPTGRCVGGTTTINAGTCFRTPPHVLNHWRQTNDLLDVDLESYFPEVETMLDAKPVDPSLHGPIRDIAARGLEGTGYICEPLKRAETGCDGQGFCITGCPTGAKRSTDVSYIPEALKRNAHLFTQYKVEELLFEKNRVIGLRAQLPGYGPEFSIRILAKKTILAAGSLNTPLLLFRAGIHSSLPQLGKNLTVHPALTVGAIFNQKVRQKLYVPQSLGAIHPHNKRFVLEGYTLPVDSVPVGMALYGRDLAYLMDHVDRFANFSAMLTDSTHGKLLLSKWGAIPYYHFDREAVDRLRSATTLLIEMFFKAGAKTVYAPVKGFERIRNSTDAKRLAAAPLKAIDFLNLSAHHPLGTCVMGTTPQNSVVSSSGKVWGYENLYIVDGSVIPGPLGVNPQVTIMANALRIARKLGTDLGVS
ncbi:GMC family oxidoreductase [Bdellovibrionota bacterium FG-1]